MTHQSIRFRLSAMYTAALAVALALFAVSLWFGLRHELIQDVHTRVSALSVRLEQFLRKEIRERTLAEELEEFSTALPSGATVHVQARNPEFRFHYPGGSAQRERSATVHRTVAIEGQRFEIEVSESLGEVDRVLGLLGLLLIGLIPVTIGMAALGGIWLGKRALAPVDRMTRAAQSITVDQLSSRLPVPASGDELQNLAETWNGLLSRIERAVGVLSQFAADASHELRTPLAVIMTNAELAVRRPRTNEYYRETLSRILAEAGRMRSLVEDLLLLARSEAQALEAPKEPLDLAELLDEVSAGMRSLSDAREIGLEFVKAEESVFVLGNRTALRRMVSALLDNALKYSRSGARVEIAMHASARKCEVAVRDFGEGIGAADLPRIFDRFWRADVARSRGSGYGLGLSVAQMIARQHGSEIRVESTAGEGSVFRFGMERFVAEEKPDEIRDDTEPRYVA